MSHVRPTLSSHDTPNLGLAHRRAPRDGSDALAKPVGVSDGMHGLSVQHGAPMPLPPRHAIGVGPGMVPVPASRALWVLSQVVPVPAVSAPLAVAVARVVDDGKKVGE